jgi:thiopeptide-type bacteriocin biosynthesis protein
MINDSIATLKFMSLNLGREKETYQWYWAILSIDYLLSDFGLNINEKETFFNIVNISMDSEFKSASKETKIVMDLKFRKLRLELIELITKKNMTDNLVNCMHQILQVRSNDNIQQIKSNKNETDKFRFYKQLMSYTHMHLNRTFSSESRKNEFVVYSLFQRYYSSLNAIDRKRTNSRSKSS